MSNPRYSFFQDQSNRSVALYATDNLTSALFDFINQNCNLTLTESSSNCSAPTVLEAYGVVCTQLGHQNTATSAYVATCDNSTFFSNATRACFFNGTQITANTINACDKMKFNLSDLLVILACSSVLLLAGIYLAYQCTNRRKNYIPIAEHHEGEEDKAQLAPSV